MSYSADDLSRELRWGVRALGRTPGFTLIVLLLLSFGIGTTGASVAIVRSILLSPLPFPRAEELVSIQEQGVTRPILRGVAGGNFAYWKSHANDLAEMAIWSVGGYNLADQSSNLPERVDAAAASWNFFSLLGVRPTTGRLFGPDDDRPGSPGTIVLTWSLWSRRYGRDPGVVGRTVLLDAKPYMIIGVLPRSFVFPDERIQLWTAVYHEYSPVVMEWHGNMPVQGGRSFGYSFNVVARLRNGVTLASASAEINALQSDIQRDFPDEIVAPAARVEPLLQSIVSSVAVPLYVLPAATLCLLLIAILNIASLLVARSASGSTSTAVRIALGANRWSIFRQFGIEVGMLFAAGGVLALMVGPVLVRLFAIARADIPRIQDVRFDSTTVLLTVSIVILSAVLVAILPSLTLGHLPIHDLLQGVRVHNTTRPRLRWTLVSAEFGLTVLLLAATGLITKSYFRLRNVNLGCSTKNILTMDVDLPSTKYTTPTAIVGFFDNLRRTLGDLPGIEGVTMATDLPGQGRTRFEPFTILERAWADERHPPQALVSAVDPGFLHTLEIPLVLGRSFTDAETLGKARIIMVNESFLRAFSRGQDLLGTHIHMNDWAGQAPGGYEIVGVVGDTRFRVSSPPQPTIYFPLYMGIFRSISVAVRSRSREPGLPLMIRKLVEGIDSSLPVSNIMTMDQFVRRSTIGAAFEAEVLSTLGCFSVVLAAVGLFGLVSYFESQRRREIGIRMALGADSSAIVRLVLANGLKPALLGLVVGLAGSLAAMPIVRSLLYEVHPLDVPVLCYVSAFIVLSAVFASVLPAFRAAQIDPAKSLRQE